MFGLLISGRFVDTSFREVDATHCVIDIPDSSSFSYVVVSIATLTLTRYIITLVNIHLWQFRHWLTKMYFALPNVVCSYNMKIFYKDWNIKRLYLKGTLWYITVYLLISFFIIYKWIISGIPDRTTTLSRRHGRSSLFLLATFGKQVSKILRGCVWRLKRLLDGFNYLGQRH